MYVCKSVNSEFPPEKQIWGGGGGGEREREL